MVVTESGMAMLAKELQSMKACSPMAVTESGMVTVFTVFFSTPHAFHELDCIVVVPSGMLKCPPALMLTAAIAQEKV